MLLASGPMTKERGSSRRVCRALISAGLAAVIFGATHALLVSCGGSQQSASNESAPPTTQPAAAPESANAAAPAAAAGAGDVAAGEKIYKLRCTPCHGPLGKGDGPLGKSLNPKPRDHTNSAYMTSRTDAQLLEVIMNGKGAMPGWVKTKVLTEQEARNALAFVRTLAK